MIIKKEQEVTLRKEWSKLKKKIQKQDKENLHYIRKNGKNLLKALKKRWQYSDNELFGDVRDNKIEYILHDLRND